MKFKKILADRNISIQALEDHLGGKLHRNSISNLLRGIHEPRVSTARMIVQAINEMRPKKKSVRLEDLF